jgi:hypothetical protein
MIADFSKLTQVKSDYFFIFSMKLYRSHESSHGSFNIDFFLLGYPSLMTLIVSLTN